MYIQYTYVYTVMYIFDVSHIQIQTLYLAFLYMLAVKQTVHRASDFVRPILCSSLHFVLAMPIIILNNYIHSVLL